MNRLTEIIQTDIIRFLPKIDFRELSGKTLIITGASGLIGTYILATLRTLREKGLTVNVVGVAHKNVPDYLSYFAENTFFTEGDLADPRIFKNLPKADYIIHAAGYGQPGRFMEEPLKTIELNTTATMALFGKLKKGGKFIFLSTSEVYSGLPKPPYTEEQIGATNTTHPRSCYIESKRCGEAIVNAHRQWGVNAKSARLSLAYGPGTKKGDRRVINSFIEKALNGRLELEDGGGAKRTYCYVSDAVEILWRVILQGKEPIYNVGGIGTVTIADLARKIGAILKVPVIFPETSGQVLAGAPADVRLDMTKVKNEFGKSDYVPLDEGLERTVKWQKILYASK